MIQVFSTNSALFIIIVDTAGILVHSCFVRDGIGNEFPLLDKRGFALIFLTKIKKIKFFRCPTDDTLMKPIIYSQSLNESFTPPLGAFKFAEQMTVYFKCQITLCYKIDNGCEGISVFFLLIKINY